MEPYQQHFLFKTIFGKTIVFQMFPQLFDEFQNRIIDTPYRIVYFGTAYPNETDNIIVKLTYDQYMNESTFIIDTSKTKNFEEMKDDIQDIVDQLNNIRRD